MSQRTVTRRYATALYEEADAAGGLAAVDDDVLMLRNNIESNRELSRFFESPVIPQEKKESILQELLEERVETLTLQFLRLLVQKDRETLTKAILDQYQSLRDEQRGIVDAEVTVAQPLNDEDRTALVEALEEKTGKDVRLHLEENPDLIGGLVIRIGDRVFDGSVRSQLNALRDQLQNATLSLEDNGARHAS
ncbi:MAG: F0F1 ATP synthase subunit delta [Bacteroidetes bacterium QH_10_64_37]|jgi:F-type H+-transporting ATPase subunit delta|nr:MAG: F0F1 ATP synthase subunit delta [Bacteroidetes bacterium QH_10_64_37]